MSGREPMQHATVEAQSRQNDSNPTIAHKTSISRLFPSGRRTSWRFVQSRCAGRKEGLNVDFLKEPDRDGVMNKDEEEDYIPFRTLIEEGLKNSVDKGIKVVIDNIDEVDKRLRKVEAFVKEAKGKSASTRDVKPSFVEQESEEVALASTTNDEATRKRKASDDVIQNMCG
ncbi:putative protein-like [Raphanus sativus]|nr:putative protein-like [Raphanus sativus]